MRVKSDDDVDDVDVDDFEEDFFFFFSDVDFLRFVDSL
jgi:hypothetical protein